MTVDTHSHQRQQSSQPFLLDSRISKATVVLSLPSASYVPSHKKEYTEEEEGEYVEEEKKVDIDPPWPEHPTGRVTLYAYDREGHGSSEYAILDTAPLYDRADVES